MNNFKIIWWIIFIILIICVSIYIEVTKPAVKNSLSIATGPIGSDSYAYALAYQGLLEKEGITLDIIDTKGSLDSVDKLQSKKVDIAFVHSGLLINQREYNLESLGSIYYEPLWIFYKNKGYSVNYLIEATNNKVAISTSNDSTLALIKQLSIANGLLENINPLYITDNEAQEKFLNNEIDFFITLGSENNPNITSLLNDPQIELMNLKRIQAYIQKFEYLKDLKIYEGSLNLYRNIPSQDINILSTTQNLVVNSGLPGELIRIFLKKVQTIHSEKTFFQTQNEFINMNAVDTMMNDDARLYILNGDSWLEKIFPYWIASNIDRLKLFLIPLIWLIIPLVKSIIPLYIFTMRSKIFKWYKRLDMLNHKIEKQNNKKELQQELEVLKNEIMRKTDVPLSYKGEYYNLLIHIELLQKKIDGII